jgi:DNA mismatch repair protein MutL
MSPLLASQIAAGEVVERPASVVKEAVENALDAGATQITVELEQGGLELIRVTDNGAGIPESELALALTPHATSKLREVSDLDGIATMGFRGEALAAITSVGRVTLRSRTADQPGAAEITGEGDVIGPVRPAPGPVGTMLTVRTLFFNTPARRNFLRSPATEQGRCVDVVRTLATAHPGVGFAMICDARRVLDFPAGQSARQRAVSVLGSELEPELLEVHHDPFDHLPGSVPPSPGGVAGSAVPRHPVTLWGLVGTPALARASAAAQFIFVNGRPVRDRVIQHALKEAYRGLIEPSRHPTAVLMIDLDPRGVDVNVHPAKAEVRFRDSSSVHSAVLRSIRAALSRADLTPTMEAAGAVGSWPAGFVPTRESILPSSGVDPITSAGAHEPRGWVTPSAPFPRHEAAVAGPRSAARARVVDAGALVRWVAQQRSGAGGLARVDEIRQAMSAAPGAAVPGRADPAAGARASDLGGTAADRGSDIAETLPPALNPALQVFDSFLITQDEQGVVIIDQHALHERVMFEKLLERVTRGDLESQRLLVPIAVPASPRQIEALERLRDPERGGLLARLGIEAAPSGPGSVNITAFTTLLFDRGVDPGEFLVELLDKASDQDWGGSVPLTRQSAPQAPVAGGSTDRGGVIEAALHEVLDMMACKAAVKAGDRLSDAELAELLALRERVERSSSCPHGRPTSIRMSVAELYRRFGRT